MLLRPMQRKTIRRLREVLNQLYSHLDNSAYAGAADVSIFINTLGVRWTERDWEILKFSAKCISAYAGAVDNKSVENAVLVENTTVF